jgi:hypothetical protein
MNPPLHPAPGRLFDQMASIRRSLDTILGKSAVKTLFSNHMLAKMLRVRVINIQIPGFKGMLQPF